MKTYFERVQSLFKKHPVGYSVSTVLLAIIVFYSWPKTPEPVYETVVVAKTDLVQQVEATGKVRPAEERDLSFQRGGTVASVAVEVGDAVKAGQALVSLDSSELQAQLRQAQATVSQEENTLVELKRGVRPEELAQAQTAVINAQRALVDANKAYDTADQKTKADLVSAYDGAITSAQSSMIVAKNALVSLSDIQYTYFISTGVSSEGLIDAKAIAVQKLLGTSNAGLWNGKSINDLSGGVYNVVQNLSASSEEKLLENTFDDSLVALTAVSNALGAMPILTSFSSTDKTELSAQKSAVSGAVSALSAKLQVVAVQKSANASALASAKGGITVAENTLRSAQDTLLLKQAGSTKEAIATQESRVASAYAQRDLIQTQVKTMTLVSPIAGIITSQNARKGVFVQAGSPIVSIISSGGFEIEIFVPEIDVAKVAVGDIADVTLDAYNDSDIFKATVVSIDPSETVIEGVSTYKVTLTFMETDSTKIRSGMTANVSIFIP